MPTTREPAAMWHTEFNLITAYPARLGKAAAQGPAGLESRTAVLLPAGQRAVLWVTHRAAELAAFPDVVDLAVRRHAGSRAAG